MTHLEGLIAATYTPLTPTGELNLPQVGPLVEHLLGQGVDGLFVGGSTGEGMSLTTAERKDLAAEFIQAAAGRVPVLVHAGHNSLADAADLARHAAQAGATAVSATCPSYYPIGSVDLLVDCMNQVGAAASDLPFYYYHIPVLTAVDVPMPQFLQRAGDHIDNLAGLKFTKAAVHEYQACLNFDDGRFDILWGFDEMLLAAFSVGARGAVGSTYNIAAPLYQQLLAAFAAGDLQQARQLQGRSVELIGVLASHPFHSAVKQVLAWQGVDCGPTRLPMPPLGEAAVLKEQLVEAGFADLTGVAQPAG